MSTSKEKVGAGAPGNLPRETLLCHLPSGKRGGVTNSSPGGMFYLWKEGKPLQSQ